MIRMKEIFYVIIAIGIVSLSAIAFQVYAQITPNDVTIDNAGRREYGYCPIAPETMSSRVQFEINGCPLVRVYIVNWNELTPTEQTNLDTQMRASGFRDIGEFDSRVR